MIHFSNVACQQAFFAAVEADPRLLSRCFNMVERWSSELPAVLYLTFDPRDSADPKYFDFGVFKAELDFCQSQPGLSNIKPFVPNRDNLYIAGGLVKSASGWGSHT